MKLQHFHKLIFSLAILLLCTSGLLLAQAVTGTLLGTITDGTGASVPNAKITITEINTGTTRSTTTSESGTYTFPDLPSGTYSASAEQTGFKRITRSNVEVQINSSPRVDFTLQPGNVSESVEVTAAPPALQTDRADTGSFITSVQTENMPLGTGRNFQNLLNLVPGTTRAAFQHSNFFNAAGSLQTEVNGQMRQGNNYQIEGIDDNERTGLLQIIVPPIEAIQTVSVSTSNFDAELGRASGAVTNVQLKSGTNNVHGAAYEFLRNSEFNARNFFDPAVGHLTYNYFGGNVGGPIIKNKLFFFGDILRQTDHQANTNLVNIPSLGIRNGDLSKSATTIYDPATGNPDGTGRTPFAGNIIPANRINPISAKILNLVPGPNTGSGETNNYFALLPYHKDTTSFDYKMDYNITERDRLSGRFSYARPVVFQAPIFGAAGGPAQGAFEGTGVQKTYSTGLNYTRIWTNSLVMEARVGVAHYHNEAQNTDFGTAASTALGIPGVNIDRYSSGLVGINLNGGYSGPIVGYSASVPWVRAEANINVVNTWTKNFRNHTIKWGVDLRRLRDELLQMQTFSPRGVFNFADGQTSIPGEKTSFTNNFASFLLDLPNQSGRDLATYFPAYRAWQFFGFAQDQWVVSPKLTLNLGVRWEFYPPATPRFKGGFSNYNFATKSLEIAGVGNVPSNLGLETHYNNFAPRLGVAYRMNEKTVIRTGFGISYTPFPDNNYAYNYPVRANNAFNPGVASYGPALLPDGTVSTFQRGFPAPINVPIPDSGIIPLTGSLTSANYFTVSKSFKNPYVESWNFAIQRALPAHFTIDVAYVGNHGVHNVTQYNLNAATVLGLGNAGLPEYSVNKRTASTTLLFGGFSSMYNGLQVKIDRKFSTGLIMTTAYTWAKGMNYQQGDDGGLMYYINLRRNYARADFDRTQTFVQSYIYDLPFGKGKRWLSNGMVSKAIGGWRVNGILTLMTGTPLNFTASSADLLAPGNQQSPNQIAPVTLPKGINTGNEWFSRSSLQLATKGSFGSVGRNAISGPSFFNLDASLFKIFHLTERFNLEVRGEAFGVTNSPQFNNPNTTLGNAAFGYITGAGGGRNLQLGFKLNF